MKLEDLKIAIYAEGADVQRMLDIAKKSYIKGFTTNPSLMKKAGVKDYLTFARKVLAEIKELPVSFEVFSDDFDGMRRELRILSSLGNNVYVKIPVTNSKGEPSYDLIHALSEDAGIKVNVTAVFTFDQIRAVTDALSERTNSIIPVFAGRIADAGVDAKGHMQKAKSICQGKASIQLLWASCREVYNIIEAENSGADIITVTNDLLKKAEKNLGKDLEVFSLETVNMFVDDSKELGFSISK